MADYLGDDDMGADYDIVGDENLMGAAPRRGPMGARTAMVRRGYTKARRWVQPLGATAIAAGATTTITVQPQVPFRVERLVTTGTGLLITDFRVGQSPQFTQAGSVPNEVFQANAFDVNLRGDTATPGNLITITVNNPTGAPITFAGAILGEAAD